jgi:hypothetical protein
LQKKAPDPLKSLDAAMKPPLRPASIEATRREQEQGSALANLRLERGRVSALAPQPLLA